MEPELVILFGSCAVIVGLIGQYKRRKTMNDELIARLLRYSRNCIASRLDPDFADAIGEAIKTIGELRVLKTLADAKIERLEAKLPVVVHGNWEEDCTGAAICSVCGEYAFETSTHHLCGWFPNFCPNCGAKMREGEE